MIRLRMQQVLYKSMVEDLERPHAYAAERIGFMCCRQMSTPSGVLLLGYRYEAIDDDRYIPDGTVGAKFDSTAIRFGMQLALTEQASILHVHIHGHRGVPRLSRVDEREMAALMPCFVNVCPDKVHGALVLSTDRACARIWGTTYPNKGAQADRITVIGSGVGVLS